MMPRHYAPRTALECVEAGEETERFVMLVRKTAASRGLRSPIAVSRRLVYWCGVMPSNPAGYAARLYAVLHELDTAGLDRILVTLPPDIDDWLAVRDRLHRAASN